MTKLRQSKEYSDEASATHQGAAYMRAFSQPGRDFGYSVKPSGTGCTLEVAFTYAEDIASVLDIDGFRPCGPTPGGDAI